ncbi:MAG: diguanylate cyclase, partial [Nocardioidaceae bacterium]
SLVSSGFLLLASQPHVREYVEMTKHARDAHEAMLDQETGLRGWLATGDRVFLEPYDSGRSTVHDALQQLLQGAQGDAPLTDEVVAMLLAGGRWRAWATRAADLHVTAAQRQDGTLTAFLLEGKRLFDHYRAAEKRSTDLLRSRRNAAMRHERDTLLLVLLVNLATLTAAAVLAVRRRRTTDATVVEPIDHLLVTIAAMRDGDLRAQTPHTRVHELDQVGAALHQLATALDVAHAEAEVREQRLGTLAARLATVVRVGREITGSLSVRYVSDTVTTAAAELIGAPITLWGRDEDSHLVVRRRSCDTRDAAIPTDLPVPPLVLASAANARPRSQDGSSAYPLVLGGTVVGVLEAARADLDAETTQVLEALLSTAAAALESAHLHSTARELADVDALTRLPNRRRFETDAEDEWERCRRSGRPLSLIMLDLDHFKRLNDEHGHLLGDQALQSVSAAVAAALRGSDTAYRYGGEELVVLLRDTSLSEAAVVAERIRAAVASVVIADHPGLAVTCSAGVAERNGGMGHHSQLVAVADAALYDAKRAGRNRVATEPVPAT